MRHIVEVYFAVSLIQDLIDYATFNGVGPNRLDTLIDPEHSKYTDFETMVKALNYLNEKLRDENLGMHIGESLSLKVTAPVNDIMLNSQTLEDSINNAIEYSKVISDALTCALVIDEGHYSITYEENPNWKVQQEYAKRQIVDLALLSNVKSLAAYTNQRYHPVRIHFSYEKPKNINEHYRLFNCSLKFNQPLTEIFYDKQLFRQHKSGFSLGLLESLKQKVTEEIALLTPEDPFIYQLKKCILKAKPQRLTISEAADQFNTSVRTLQRKLKQLNTTFKIIEHQLQLRLAKTYLEEKQRSIEEISYLLGFSESSAFIRFFKSVTSKTPKEYQKGV